MKVYKCGMLGCNAYITEDELNKVKYNGKIIDICSSCDDGSLELLDGGEHFDTIEKAEKFRKKRNQWD